MCEYLDRLKNMTGNLPDIKPLEDFKNVREGFVEYIFDKGVVKSINLFNDKDISIAKTFIPKGITFQSHIHNDSYEVLIVLNGKLEITVEGITKVLNKHEKIDIYKQQNHSAKALDDTDIIVLAVPSDKGFPD